MSKNSLKSPQLLMRQLTEYSPMLLFVAMLLTFIFMGVLQNKFYSDLFYEPMPELSVFLGIGGATIFQIMRMASGLTSAFLFKNGNTVKGIIVLAFSLWLSYTEHIEAGHMAETWGAVQLLDENNALVPETSLTASKDAFLLLLRMFIWASLALELGLAFTMTSKSNSNELDASILPEMDKSFSSNGQSKKKATAN